MSATLFSTASSSVMTSTFVPDAVTLDTYASVTFPVSERSATPSNLTVVTTTSYDNSVASVTSATSGFQSTIVPVISSNVTSGEQTNGDGDTSGVLGVVIGCVVGVVVCVIIVISVLLVLRYQRKKRKDNGNNQGTYRAMFIVI